MYAALGKSTCFPVGRTLKRVEDVAQEGGNKIDAEVVKGRQHTPHADNCQHKMSCNGNNCWHSEGCSAMLKVKGVWAVRAELLG